MCSLEKHLANIIAFLDHAQLHNAMPTLDIVVHNNRLSISGKGDGQSYHFGSSSAGRAHQRIDDIQEALLLVRQSTDSCQPHPHGAQRHEQPPLPA